MAGGAPASAGVEVYGVIHFLEENAGKDPRSVMKLQRLDHFGIEVSDLRRAESFYTRILGLSVVTRFNDQVLLDCGGQNLALFEVHRTPLSPDERAARIDNPLGKGHHAFRVSNADFSTARERLTAAGVETAAAIDWGDHDCMYFLDPDGNLLEIVSYRKGES